jgi:signal transduction histidine kinase
LRYENLLLARVESALAKSVRHKNDGAAEELEVAFGGERYIVTSDRQQMLNLLLSTYENAVRQNQELIETERELQKINEQLAGKIRELEEVQDKLLRAERLATIGQLGASLSRTTVPEKVAIVVKLAKGLPPLMADPGQIEQVFINILSNAVQAMSNEGRLEIITRKENGFVVTEFTDNGCGISKENMKRLFEPLFTTKAKGIGLGLAVSQRIVEAHGGKIEVASPPAGLGHNQPGEVTGEMGKGTTFRIKLPISVG